MLNYLCQFKLLFIINFEKLKKIEWLLTKQSINGLQKRKIIKKTNFTQLVYRNKASKGFSKNTTQVLPQRTHAERIKAQLQLNKSSHCQKLTFPIKSTKKWTRTLMMILIDLSIFSFSVFFVKQFKTLLIN